MNIYSVYYFETALTISRSARDRLTVCVCVTAVKNEEHAPWLNKFVLVCCCRHGCLILREVTWGKRGAEWDLINFVF